MSKQDRPRQALDARIRRMKRKLLERESDELWDVMSSLNEALVALYDSFEQAYDAIDAYEGQVLELNGDSEGDRNDE